MKVKNTSGSDQIMDGQIWVAGDVKDLDESKALFLSTQGYELVDAPSEEKSEEPKLKAKAKKSEVKDEA